MSFCRILSTLCSRVVFHNLPHFSLADGKRAGQKVHRKIAAAVQNVKPLYNFVPFFWNPRKILSTIILFVLVIKLTIIKETRRRVSRGRDYRWWDRRWKDCRGRVLRDFSLFKPNLINMNVHCATCSCSVELYKLWYTLADFLPNCNFRGVFSIYSIKLGVGHGPVDKAPGCCKVALGSNPQPSTPKRVIQGGWTAHRRPHQNSWMNSPTENAVELALRKPWKKKKEKRKKKKKKKNHSCGWDLA
jgi:hypothetical protein